jgi:glucose-6-phosphate isomerase
VNPAWQALLARRGDIDPDYMGDPTFRREWDGIHLDFTRQLFDTDTFVGLLALAYDCGVEEWRSRLFAGDKVNHTEDRAALHMALRAPAGTFPVSDAVVAELERCIAFDADGFTDIVNIGIGGSHLGPALVVDALWPFHVGHRRFHFVANADGADLARTLSGCNPKTTLFIVASKTFTTQETLLNAQSARAWLENALGEDAVARHFVAVTTAGERAAAFGIPAERVFGFWDWVGGRYSVWSAIGLSVMIALGRDGFSRFLAGAHAVDTHFQDAPYGDNLPVLMALVAVWNRNIVGTTSHAVLPYAESLRLLPAYLQQLVMESLGKRVDRDGQVVDHATAPVVWGMQGTNGQHAFHQMLHQGTDVVPVDFIGFRQPVAGQVHNQSVLNTHLRAQADALWQGRDTGEPHRDCPGRRPSTILEFERLDPYSLGQLLALYEHQVFVQSVLWNLNPFDQFGVELGKDLAARGKS